MTIRKLNLSALLALCTLLSPSAVASVKVSGHFVATEACPVYQSIKKKTNPGNHKTEPGTRYPALFLNKPMVIGYKSEFLRPNPTPDGSTLNVGNLHSRKLQASNKPVPRINRPKRSNAKQKDYKTLMF